MIQLDKMAYGDIRMAAVTTNQFAAMAPLSSSVKRFDDAMALHQNSVVSPDMTVVTPVQPAEKTNGLTSAQRSILRQIILHGVKPEAEE